MKDLLTTSDIFLGLFVKSNTDGEKRSEKIPIYVAICLDISGSMGGAL